MKKKVIISLFILLLCGCSLMQSKPKEAVNKFLNNYKNNSDTVIEELNNYLDTQDIDSDTKEDYKEIYLRQYSNLKYKIKDEKIDGDKANVDVEITVYDYYKTNKTSGEYFTANQADFIKDDGDIDFSKYLKYKLNKLLATEDTVTYTLKINLNKVDNKWEIEPLTNEQLSKLHGTYEYEK